MNVSSLEKWISIAANTGVLIGIVFVVIEFRTNTESNIISVSSTSQANYVEMNLAFASEELARIRVKAAKGEQLNDIEEEQMLAIWRTYLSQSNLTRLLFDKGIATEEELSQAYGGLRDMARNNEWVRQREPRFTEGLRLLIYEEDGIQKYAQMTK